MPSIPSVGTNPNINNSMPIDNQRSLSEEANAVIQHADPSKANLAGRIFLGIFSVGLSECIRAIVHHVGVGRSVDRMAAILTGRNVEIEQAADALKEIADKHPRTAFKVWTKLFQLNDIKANDVEGVLLSRSPDSLSHTFRSALVNDFSNASVERQTSMSHYLNEISDGREFLDQYCVESAKKDSYGM